MSLFITASDVRKLILNNETELHVSGEYRLTDVAREMLQANNIRIVKGEKAQAAGGNIPDQRQELKGSSSDGTNIRSVVTGNAAPVSAVLSSDNNAVNRVDYDLVILGGQCVIPEMGILKTNIGIKGDKIVALTKDLITGTDRTVAGSDTGGHQGISGTGKGCERQPSHGDPGPVYETGNRDKIGTPRRSYDCRNLLQSGGKLSELYS